MEVVSGIYKIENLVNGKVYVGSSKNLHVRWKDHILNLNKNKHYNRHLQHAWNKYGKYNFCFDIIEIVDNLNNIKEKEQYWLDNLKPFGDNGYNICKTTNSYTFGYKLSVDTIKKLKNRKLTKEVKQLMRLNNTRNKKVVQIDLDGNYINMFFSINEASRQTNINNQTIRKCCFDKGITAGNYFWMYYSDYISNQKENIFKNLVSKYETKKDINKKEIVQLTLDGKFIRYWDSIREASNFAKTSEGYICMCCQGKARSAGDYLWLYREDYNPDDKIEYERLFNPGRKIVQLDLYYNIIKEWDNACIAARELLINFSGIYGCCNKKDNSYKGFRWLYQDDYNNNNYIKCYKNKKTKYVLQFNLDGTLIKEWNSGKEIEVNTGMKWSSIKSACNGTTKTHKHKGFIWIYKEDYEQKG